MTDLQHLLVAVIICFILWQLLFKQFFVTEKDVSRWDKTIWNWIKRNNL